MNAKYDVNKVIHLFKHTIKKRTLPEHNVMYMIWIVDYFIDHEYMDKEIIQFLVQNTLHNSDSDQVLNPDDILHDGINSIRGSAAERLTHIYFKPEFSDLIFTTLNKAANDHMECVRAAILYHLAYLNHYDKDQVCQLFLRITDTNSEQILKSGIWSVQYLLNDYFEELKPYFRKAISYDSLHNDIATVLAVGWMQNVKGCNILLSQFEKDSEQVRLSILHVAKTNMFCGNNNVEHKCRKIFKKYLGEDLKEIVQRYSSFFARLDPIKFNEFYQEIDSYSRSKICRKKPYGFIEFLYKCVTKDPQKCMRLFANTQVLNRKYRLKEQHYGNDKPVKFIVGAYNSLIQKRSGKNQIQNSLKLFDQLLMNERFRATADQALQSSDFE